MNRDVNNYSIRKEEARKRFMHFDMESIASKWKLKSDKDKIYLDFLGSPYVIMREDGQVIRKTDGSEAGFEEVLSIYDLLCHTDHTVKVSNTFAPVNSLKGPGKSLVTGVGDNKVSGEYGNIIKQMSVEEFRERCEKSGGKRIDIGDVGYEFQVFKDLKLRIQYYEADEEFPATATLLWDENTLQFMFYETAFYIMGYLMEKVLKG